MPKKPPPKPAPKRKPAAKATPKARAIPKAAGESERNRAAAVSRDNSKSVREIGPLPSVANLKRKARCSKSLRDFCRTYFPARFKLKFSRAQDAIIERMERCVRGGGLFCCAFMRGGGKTTIAEVAVLWAVAYGYRRFVVLVQATQPHAGRSLKKIRSELEFNGLLLEDFPEVCYPIRRLERIVQRSKGQTLGCEPTRMEWTAEGLMLPSVKGSKASGAIFHVVGIEGAVRGLSMSGPEGEILRPDLVLIDDAQTRESAKSPTQTTDREAIVTDDVLGLAGPDVEIAVLNLCTPIYPLDLSERFLDQKRHPEWQGLRTKMLEEFPTRRDLWDQYAEIRRESLRSGDEGKRATDFYAANREAMDAGAVVSWPERKRPRELSGLQSAMNIHIDNPRGFKAEFQCHPEEEAASSQIKSLVPAKIAERFSGCDRWVLPRECSRLTAFVDVGVHLHWYAVLGWTERFSGTIIDYGTWPRQTRTVFEHTDPRPGLGDVYKDMAEEARTYAGLVDLTNEILGRAYRRDTTGEEVRIERCLVDSGDQTSTVYLFCRQSPHAGVIYPSKGIARTNSARGVAEWKPRPGERSGYHWRLTMSETGIGRSVQFDPDMWKSFVYQRTVSPMGTPGALTLWGKEDSGVHEMISQHMAAEYGDPQTIRGVTFDKWFALPHKPDNHLWDCVVGAAVAANVQGLPITATTGEARPEEPKVKVIDMKEEARKARAENADSHYF